VQKVCRLLARTFECSLLRSGDYASQSTLLVFRGARGHRHLLHAALGTAVARTLLSDPLHAGRAHPPRMLIAREATTTSVESEIELCSIISNFARAVSGKACVGLNAVAVEKPRNK
jgi:hypothetical protein